MVNKVFSYLRTLFMFLIKILSLKCQQSAYCIICVSGPPLSPHYIGLVHLTAHVRKGFRKTAAKQTAWRGEEKRRKEEDNDKSERNEKKLPQRS